MKFFIDLSKKQLIKSAASNVALDRLVLKRRDSLAVEVVFVSRNAVASMPAGTTSTVALKRSFADSNFLALASGEPPILDLNTTPIEAIFSETNPASISALLEIRWSIPGETTRNATLAVELQNSVILGNEQTPQALPDGKATQAEAEAGTDHTKWMTPLRTAQAIEALATSAHFGPNPPPAGSNDLLWVDTDTGRHYALIGTQWIETGSSGSGGAGGVTSYNDLTDRPTLGTAAATNATAYATAAQGAKADSASQPGHTHTIADTTGLASSLAAKITGSGVADMQVVTALPSSPSPTTFYIVIPTGATTASAVTLGSVSLFTGTGGDGGGGGGEPTWTPASLTSLALWLDATTGLYDSTSGGALVTTPGSTIGRWEDRSTNARHFTQSTVNSRPVLASSNGKSTVTFDGTDDFLDGLYTRSYPAQSLFVVFSIASSKTQAGIFAESITGATDQANYLAATQKALQVGATANGSATLLSPQNITLSSFAIGTYTHTGTQIINYLNGTAAAAAADTFPSANYEVVRARLGGRINSNGTNTTGQNLSGSIAEVIAYDRLLTTAERQEVEAYLGTKWGISL